jgi:hypothetical protein
MNQPAKVSVDRWSYHAEIQYMYLVVRWFMNQPAAHTCVRTCLRYVLYPVGVLRKLHFDEVLSGFNCPATKVTFKVNHTMIVPIWDVRQTILYCCSFVPNWFTGNL